MRCPGQSNCGRSAVAQAHFKLIRRTSLTLRTDNSPGWQADPPFQGEAACHCVVQREYVPVEIIPAKPNVIPGRPETVRLHPGTGVRFHSGILFEITPERRSESSRNRVHLAPDSPCRSREPLRCRFGRGPGYALSGLPSRTRYWLRFPFKCGTHQLPQASQQKRDM